MSDIRKGDLIKATRKTDPEEHRQGRVVRLLVDGVVFTSGLAIDLNHYDIEVLDRPVPAISAELLFGAVDAYRKAYDDLHAPTNERHIEDLYYGSGIRAVINYVRQNDNYLKENAK